MTRERTLSDSIAPFMERVAAHRALQLSEEEWLQNSSTLSLETQEDLVESNILVYVQDHFGDFIRALRFLSKQDQELLLSYYVLRKTQNTLGPLIGTTQSICSYRLRDAVKHLGTFIMLGEPTKEVMAEILTKAGLENSLPDSFPVHISNRHAVALSRLVEAYAKVRNFKTVADHFHIHRASIRRALKRASKKLLASKDPRENALGAYIHSLVDKASASGQGLAKRQRAKQVNVYRTDPAILDRFRIDAADPEFEHVFAARANL